MAVLVPSNEACYDRVIVRGELGTGRFFQVLQQHSERHGLLESTFASRLKPQFFDVFWELYVAAALHEAHFAVKRGRAEVLEPDFYFRSAESTVFIEAVACGDPTSDDNRVPPPDDDDFEGGIAPEGRIFQRLAQAIDGKITAVARAKARAAMEGHGPHSVVVALNGCRAFNGHPHGDICSPFVPPIARLLFGAIDQLVNRDGRAVSNLSDRARKEPKAEAAEFPVAHFGGPLWRVADRKSGKERSASVAKIAGVLYSQITPWHTAVPLGGDFAFIQNPFGPDLTELFGGCKGKVWVHRGGSIRPLDHAEKNHRPTASVTTA